VSIHSCRYARVIVALVAVAELCGCSSLAVQVDVLRPEVLSARIDADAIARVMPLIAAEDDLLVDRVFVDLGNQHFKAYQDIRKQYRETAQTLPATSQDRTNLEIAAKSLEDGVPQEISDFYDRKQSEVKSANAGLRTYWDELRAATDDASREIVSRKMLATLAQRQALLASAYDMFAHDLDQQIVAATSPAATNAARVVLTAQTSTRRNMKQLFDGGGFIDSRYTYYVVAADKEHWAPMFDRTLARGIFGNTDIAIKALGPGNFTIKGLSFNPADVAATASKVATQTVLLAAQIAGVPVKVSGTPDSQASGAALATSSTSYAQTLAANAQADEKVQAHRDALLRIASSILQERKTIASGTDEDRKTSLEVIKAVYASHAARLPVSAN
jgi:hypothetical protein